MHLDRRGFMAAGAAFAGGALIGREAFADIALAPPESVGFRAPWPGETRTPSCMVRWTTRSWPA